MPSRAGTDGPEILDQHIGGLDHAVQDRQPFRLLQIERERALAAVGAEKEAALARQARRKLAQHVALRRFDLDHVGAEIGQQRAAIGAGEIAAQIEDGDAVERPGRFVRHHRPSRARIAATFCNTRCAR